MPPIESRVDSKLGELVSLENLIRDSFIDQAVACRTMGSPFTAMVCQELVDLLDASTETGRAVSHWSGDPKLDALPLRLAGGLNRIALSGSDQDLASGYPPSDLPTPERLRTTLGRALDQHDRFLHDYLESPPQTNEVARSAAILVGCSTITARFGLPLALYEIGASAGLNLWFDKYRYHLGLVNWGDLASQVLIRCDWTGRIPPLANGMTVVARYGCDQRPLNPASEADRLRLLSYVWPDQTERVARIKAALELAARENIRVEKADAADWVAKHLNEPTRGVVKVLVNTVVWQYLDADHQSAITRALEQAGERATEEQPIAWLQLEHDGRGPGAGLNLRMWPNGEEHLLARFDFHGRWAEGLFDWS